MIRLPALAAVVLACVLSTAPASAETSNCVSIESLPAVISTPGAYCLRKDLATSLSTGSAIEITTNSVTLDCNGHKVGGLAAGAATQANGIAAIDRSNTTIRNCNVRGFLVGINVGWAFTSLPLGNVVEQNRVEGATRRGIVISGTGSVARGNTVTDIGGNPYNFQPTGIVVTYNADAIDNLIDGVASGPGAAVAVNGITLNDASGSTVIGNRIRNLVSDSVYERGIADFGPERNFLIGNTIAGTGISFGITCNPMVTVVRDNTIIGANAGLSGAEDCLDGGGNVVLVPEAP